MSSAGKFDADRAGEYERQSRIGLAGYDACHELTACVLASTLGADTEARVLVTGAGGGAKEIVVAGTYRPNWRFVAVDPSPPMMDLAIQRVTEAGLQKRTEFHLGYVHDLPSGPSFDAATLIGVLHHLPGRKAKEELLGEIASRLAPEAPFVLAGNYRPYASEPLLMRTWAERWRMQGAAEEEVTAKLGKLLQGADPPVSEQEVFELLAGAGFVRPLRFFGSLFWGAWVSFREAR